MYLLVKYFGSDTYVCLFCYLKILYWVKVLLGWVAGGGGVQIHICDWTYHDLFL